jgi:hypothetical protein
MRSLQPGSRRCPGIRAAIGSGVVAGNGSERDACEWCRSRRSRRGSAACQSIRTGESGKSPERRKDPRRQVRRSSLVRCSPPRRRSAGVGARRCRRVVIPPPESRQPPMAKPRGTAPTQVPAPHRRPCRARAPEPRSRGRRESAWRACAHSRMARRECVSRRFRGVQPESRGGTLTAASRSGDGAARTGGCGRLAGAGPFESRRVGGAMEYGIQNAAFAAHVKSHLLRTCRSPNPFASTVAPIHEKFTCPTYGDGAFALSVARIELRAAPRGTSPFPRLGVPSGRSVSKRVDEVRFP